LISLGRRGFAVDAGARFVGKPKIAAPVPSCGSQGGGGAPGCRTISDRHELFRILGVDVRRGLAAMEVESSGDAEIKFCEPLEIPLKD